MKENRNSIILTVLKGMVVGTGAILPGVSGGVLCMAFGIYEPLMDVLSDPAHKFKKYLNLLLPFVIGWVLGFLLLAKVLEVLFLKYETAATLFFAGAILGTIPNLLKSVDFKTKNYPVLIGWTLLFSILFIFLEQSRSFNIEANLFWYFFCGIVWGLSMIIPGLSSSSLLIMMGLYQDMTAGIARFDPGVILPLMLGVAVTVLSLSKVVHHLFEVKRKEMILLVSGIMIASSLCMMIKVNYDLSYILLYILLFAAGFIMAEKLDG
jgi:putative membrane protein